MARATSPKRPPPARRTAKPSKRGIFGRIVAGVFSLIVVLYLLSAFCVFTLRWIDPPITTVQIQRRVQAMIEHRPYKARREFIPLARISPNLQHAVISAEDGRFYQHKGFDWIEMRKVLEDDMRRQKLGRGGSTITQQLVKNLFLTTQRSIIRKGVESVIVPLVEMFLTKDRILELYLNVIEWGPGFTAPKPPANSTITCMPPRSPAIRQRGWPPLFPRRSSANQLA